MTRVVSNAIAGLILALCTASAADENWPQFRGPHSGIAADDAVLPDSWSASENIVWKVDVPGRGWSSPVVWGHHVIVTTAINSNGSDEPLKSIPSYTPRSFGGPMSGRDVGGSPDPQRWVLYDFDFNTGKVRWERILRTGVPAETKHQKNSYASETPVTDGEHVYAYLGNFGLFAFDMRGTPVWSKAIGPFRVRNGWWHASSPALHRNRVYVVNDNDEQSFIAAFDKRTGEEVWRASRDEGSNWTTPFVWENGQRTEIVTAGTQKVRSYDLNGQPLWTLTGMASIAIPTPIAGQGLLFITSGYPGDQLRPAYAIRAGASGDISLKNGEAANAFVAWSNPTLGPYNPSPLVYGEYYYTLFDRGFFSCHDAKTGKEIYGRQRIAAGAAGFTASPWAYNGRIFALSEDGTTYVVQAGAEFKVLRTNSLDEMTLATPAVAHGSLIIRTASKLYRITNHKDQARK
jgi:outer membrane protein assembly factor BamB